MDYISSVSENLYFNFLNILSSCKQNIVVIASMMVTGVFLTLAYTCCRSSTITNKNEITKPMKRKSVMRNRRSRKKAISKHSVIQMDSSGSENFCPAKHKNDNYEDISVCTENEQEENLITKNAHQTEECSIPDKEMTRVEEVRSLAIQTVDTLLNSAYVICDNCSEADFANCEIIKNAKNFEPAHSKSLENHPLLKPSQINLQWDRRNAVNEKNIGNEPDTVRNSFRHLGQTEERLKYCDVNCHSTQNSGIELVGCYDSCCSQKAKRSTVLKPAQASKSSRHTFSKFPSYVNKAGEGSSNNGSRNTNIASYVRDSIEEERLRKLRQQLCVDVSGFSNRNSSCQTPKISNLGNQKQHKSGKCVPSNYNMRNSFLPTRNSHRTTNRHKKIDNFSWNSNSMRKGNFDSRAQLTKFTQTEPPKYYRSLSTQTISNGRNRSTWRDDGSESYEEESFGNVKQKNVCYLWRDLLVKKRDRETQVNWLSPISRRAPFNVYENTHFRDNYTAWRNHKTKVNIQLKEKERVNARDTQNKNYETQRCEYDYHFTDKTNEENMNSTFAAKLLNTSTQTSDYPVSLATQHKSLSYAQNLSHLNGIECQAQVSEKFYRTNSFCNLNHLQASRRPQGASPFLNQRHSKVPLSATCSPCVYKYQSTQTDNSQKKDNCKYFHNTYISSKDNHIERQKLQQEKRQYKFCDKDEKGYPGQVQKSRVDKDRRNNFVLCNQNDANEEVINPLCEPQKSSSLQCAHDYQNHTFSTSKPAKNSAPQSVRFNYSNIPPKRCESFTCNSAAHDNESIMTLNSTRRQNQSKQNTGDESMQDHPRQYHPNRDFCCFKENPERNEKLCINPSKNTNDLSKYKESEKEKRFLNAWNQHDLNSAPMDTKLPKENESFSSDIIEGSSSTTGNHSNLSYRPSDAAPPTLLPQCRTNDMDEQICLKKNDDSSPLSNDPKEITDEKIDCFDVKTAQEKFHDAYDIDRKAEVVNRIKGMYPSIDCNIHETNGKVVKQVQEFLKTTGKWKFQN